jgi:RNA polymerase sigma factor (sigma-70 family)
MDSGGASRDLALNTGYCDARKFEDLCFALAPRMKSLAARLTGSPAAAEDVFQEAVLRVWQRLPDLDPAVDLQSYFARVVVNLCTDSHRRKVRESRSPILDVENVPAPSKAAEELILRELMPELRRVLESLPEQQRSALVLRYFQGLEYAQVAALLGCQESTARNHVSTAKAALKRKLKFVPAFKDLCLREDKQ